MEPRQRLHSAVAEAYDVGEVWEHELVVPTEATYAIAPGLAAQYDFELAELASLTSAHLDALAWEALPVWLSHPDCERYPFIPRQSQPSMISIRDHQDAIHAWSVFWPPNCDHILLAGSGRLILGHPADMPDFCVCRNDAPGLLRTLDRRLTASGELCLGVPNLKGQITWVNVTAALVRLVALAYLDNLR